VVLFPFFYFNLGGLMNMEGNVEGGVGTMAVARVARVHVGRERLAAKVCHAVCATCADCRYSGAISELLVREAFSIPVREIYDDLRMAGGALGLAHFAPVQYRETVMGQLRALSELHEVCELILVSHAECGWCKLMGYSFPTLHEDRNFHLREGEKVVAKIQKEFPNLRVRYGYIKPDKETGYAELEAITF
jgi:hypothetical protein